MDNDNIVSELGLIVARIIATLESTKLYRLKSTLAEQPEISEKQIKSLLDSLISASKIFPVRVNYDIPLREAIRLGRFGFLDDNINERNFPTKYFGLANVDIRIIVFENIKSFEDVLMELDKMGLRAANLYELLALRARADSGEYYLAYDTVFALGSVGKEKRGVPYFECDNDGDESLDICLEYAWRSNYCGFAAVGK